MQYEKYSTFHIYFICIHVLLKCLFLCCVFSYRKDCSYFNMPLPDFSLLEGLNLSLVEAETTWLVYEQFSLELLDIEKEDWISFRLVCHY